MVDVVDDRREVISSRSGDDDLAGTGLDVLLRLRLGGVEARALKDNVDSHLSPSGKVGGIGSLALVDDNLLSVNDDVVVLTLAVVSLDRVVLLADLSGISALGGVILQEVGKHRGAGEVVDSDNLVAFRAEHLAESQAANAAETIDSNLYICHKSELLYIEIFSTNLPFFQKMFNQ